MVCWMQEAGGAVAPGKTGGSAVEKDKSRYGLKRAVSGESFLFLGFFFVLFGALGHRMGLVNMMNTMMNTIPSMIYTGMGIPSQ